MKRLSSTALLLCSSVSPLAQANSEPNEPAAPASSARSDDEEIVQKVQITDNAPIEEPSDPQTEHAAAAADAPPHDERAALSFGIGFVTSLTSIQQAFPWGMNVSMHGSLRIVEPLHLTLGTQVSSLQLQDANISDDIYCDQYSCTQGDESGMQISLPLGAELHVPVGEQRFIFGAGGLYAWYSADTNQPTGVRKGPGAYGRLIWCIPASPSIYYDLFTESSLIWSSGDQFQGRLPSNSSTDVWLTFGLAVRIGL